MRTTRLQRAHPLVQHRCGRVVCLRIRAHRAPNPPTYRDVSARPGPSVRSVADQGTHRWHPPSCLLHALIRWSVRSCKEGRRSRLKRRLWASVQTEGMYTASNACGQRERLSRSQTEIPIEFYCVCHPKVHSSQPATELRASPLAAPCHTAPAHTRVSLLLGLYNPTNSTHRQ